MQSACVEEATQQSTPLARRFSHAGSRTQVREQFEHARLHGVPLLQHRFIQQGLSRATRLVVGTAEGLLEDRAGIGRVAADHLEVRSFGEGYAIALRDAQPCVPDRPLGIEEQPVHVEYRGLVDPRLGRRHRTAAHQRIDPVR